MILALVAALGVAAYHSVPPPTQTASSSTAINDPIAGPIPPSSEFGIDQLYLRLRAEPRDSHWSARTEQQLHRYLTDIPYVGGANNPLRVMCGTSLCEAAGVIDVPITKRDETSLKSPLNRSMQALQGKDIHDFATKLALEILGASFQSPNKRSTMTFLIYFKRKQ